MKLPPLILASESPRRRQLLESLGVSFEIKTAPVQEASFDPDGPAALVEKNAALKAQAVLGVVAADAVVLGADTVVTLGEQVLGKPADRDEAVEMLQTLSGRVHQVFTGMALASAGRIRVSHACSEIQFLPLSPDTIARYADTREPYDKAGGYAVQGLGSLLVREVRGSYTNIVGLPVELFLREWESFTGIDCFSLFR